MRHSGFCYDRGGRGVAQLGSASALGAEGRPFESGRPDHILLGLVPTTSTFEFAALLLP